MPANETHRPLDGSSAAEPAADETQLAISTESGEHQGHPYTLIILAGQATDETRRPLREALSTQAHQSPGHLLIDLSHLTRMDPAVANELVRASRVVYGLGSSLGLVAPRPDVARTLQLSAVHDVIPLYVSIAEAMAG
jgi:anti-anti-sigma factor